MKRYALLALGISAILLAIFGLAQAMGWDLLEDPAPVLARWGAMAPVASVLLLASDVLLPIPSSLLMTGNGLWFGVAGGSLVSLAGGMAGTALAFGIGRRSTPLVLRFTAPAEREAMERLLTRWGAFAVAVTRPVPILAEACALMAGTTSMGWRALLVSAFAGSLPPAVAYAYAGAQARTVSPIAVFVAVMAAAGLLFWLGRRVASPRTTPASRPIGGPQP